MAKILLKVLANNEAEDDIEDDYECRDLRSEIIKLNYWSSLEKIKRRDINSKLRRYGSGEVIWNLIESIENREDII